jgi:CheY-like chemotaxis protein
MPVANKKILAVVDDLFFTVKISDAARRAGLEATFVKGSSEVVGKALELLPLLIIVDLNANGFQPVALIQKLKQEAALKGASVIAFVSHVQGELKQQAQEAGANMVLARSAFSVSLPLLLKRHSGAR